MSSLPVSSLKAELQQTIRPATPDEIATYQAEGYIVFPRLVSPEVAAELHREVLEIMNVVGLGQTKLKQTAQYLHGSLLEAYVQHPLLRDLASSLMQSPAHLYLPFTAVKSGGGGGQFHFHQDGNYTRYVQGQGVNLWMALSPMREENGGLRMVPRSHIKGELASENAGDGDSHRKVSDYPSRSLLLEMEPGDCVAFTRWTVHGSGPNLTDQHRVAYAVQFHSENAMAEINGEQFLLREKPRFTDIWGVDQIDPGGAGKRDGH